jgi:hypothetical protein
MDATTHSKHYGRLVVMAALSFLAMYLLMYAMVDELDNVLPNFNQAYMAGLMTAPMIVIELILMRGMYPHRKLNLAIIAVTTVAAGFLWTSIRSQTAISDEQFLKSMIPHHAGAILMCEQASLHDTSVQELCGRIIESQRREIEQMKDDLAALETRVALR